MGHHERPPRLIVAGNASIDLLLGPVAPWPKPGTETLVDHIDWRVGGALGNTALALAGMVVPARLVWDVGDDTMGAWLLAALAAAGDAPRAVHAPTSVTVALNHPDGERTFVSHLGHLAVSTPDALATVIEEARLGDLLLVGGLFLLPRWRPEIPTLLARARARGLRTALDTGWPDEGWTAPVRAELRAALAHVDLFLPNLEEGRGLLDAPNLEPDAVLAGLAHGVAGTTVLKLGPIGAAFRSEGRTVVVPAPVLDVADTVGAGDTFNAALLAALASGVPLPDAIAIGVQVASHVVATTPRRYPRWEDLRPTAPTSVGGFVPATR
ncbi:MAG: carbohydrate kinase family protein [Trueperaceae bacterium]